jgi:hypothetical protein
MFLSRDASQRWTHIWCFTLLVISVLVIPAAAFQVNRTIDDENGDPFTNLKVDYTSGWNFGPNCRVCILRVMPPTSAVNSTWHDAQTSPGGQNESFTLVFPGMMPFDCSAFAISYHECDRYSHICIRHYTERSPDNAGEYRRQLNICPGWRTFRTPFLFPSLRSW